MSRRRRESQGPPTPHEPALPEGPVPTSLGTATLVREAGAPNRVTLFLDQAESSHVDLWDPTHLEFEYMQQMRVLLDLMRPPGPVRAVHLGGAACTFARAIEAERPNSRQLAVELDEALGTLVREWFDLPRSPRLRIRSGDARAVTADLRPESWEVVVRDVFDQGVAPLHVRTTQAAASVRRALVPGGLYLVNLTDRPPLRFARQEVATLQEAFAHVVLVADPAILRRRRYGNLVLAASDSPFPMAELERDLRRLPLPVRLLTGDELDVFRGTSVPFRDEPADDSTTEAPPSSGAVPAEADAPSQA